MGKTYRDHPKTNEQFTPIVQICPYKKKEEILWGVPKIDDKNVSIPTKERACNIYDLVPEGILWEIENDNDIGCQKLSNFLNTKIALVVNNQSYYREAKGTSVNYMASGGFSGGHAKVDTYTKPVPQTKIFNPEAPKDETIDKPSEELTSLIAECDGIEVTVNPQDSHYLSNCEYRKGHDLACKSCFVNSGRTTWLKGLGNKSSGKTKGRSKEYDLNMKEELEFDEFSDENPEEN